MPAAKKLTLDDIRRDKKAPRKTIEVQMDDKKSVEFVFRGIGRKTFEDLTAAHPSKDDGQLWDAETFGPALVAASCEVPAMTEAEVVSLWDDPEWTFYECDQLFAAALSVNANFRGVR